jgi:hypothetical protein
MKLKTTMLLVLISISIISFQCGKDSADQSTLLPPITTTGANTFGCLVDGLVMRPRDGAPTVAAPYPHKGIEPVFGSDKKSVDLNFYDEKDKAPAPFFLGIHLIDTNYIQPREYKWQQTSYSAGYADHWVHHVYGSFYDSETKDYAWFGSYDSSGTTIVTGMDTINHIISGTFSGKLRKRDGTKEITISNGRFDINWATVYDKKFP